MEDSTSLRETHGDIATVQISNSQYGDEHVHMAICDRRKNPTSGIDLNNCSISQKSFFNSPSADSRKRRSFKRWLVNSACNQREKTNWQNVQFIPGWPCERLNVRSMLCRTLDYSQAISSLHAVITMSPNKAGDVEFYNFSWNSKCVSVPISFRESWDASTFT